MKKLTILKQSNMNLLKINYAKAMFLLPCVVFFCCIFALPLNAGAAATKTDLIAKHKTDLEAIETYLNNIKTLSANFVQKTAVSTSQGKFYLSRPGKMRVEYIDQPKVLIIVNGAVLTYKDLELDETSNLSTNTTPASFLTRPNISFLAKDVEVTNVKKTEDFITVSVIKKNRTEAGEFSLTFKRNPNLEFYKMEVKTDLNQTTSVTLRDAIFDQELSDNLFVIKNKNLP